MSISIIPARSILLLAALLVAGVSSSAQEVNRRIAVPDEEVTGPLLIFRNVERAWRAGNAQALSSLASESRVRVDLRGYERRGGYFTRPQIFYIFKNLFATTSQINFAFVKYHNLDKEDSRVYGIAQRNYKTKRGGRLYKDMVYVTLVKEGSQWVVAEITSTW